jgi:type VI secretion system protein VasJ
MDESLSLLGTNPIPGAEPSGIDARYEPEYAEVLAEIEKLSFSGQGAVTSWPKVESNARTILSNKSKDLQISTYLAVALWQNNGPDGLLPGVQILDGLLRVYWQTGWPPVKRIRGRVNAIDWWHERTGNYLQSQLEQNTALDASYCQKLVEALKNLEDLRSSLLPDAVPLRDLAASVERLSGPPPEKVENAAEAPKEQTPESAPESIADSAAAAAPKKPEVKTAPVSVAAPGSAASPESAPPGDAAALRRQFVEAGLNYLPSARKLNPEDPTHWRLLRLIIWGGIKSLPPVEDGRTFLPAPDITQLEAAARLLTAGKALEAALAAEDLLVTAPFYLDIQRLIHKALLVAGSQYAAAAGAVQEECVRFALRLPGVERLRFSDDAAFAAPETIAWLRSATLRQDGQDSQNGQNNQGSREASTADYQARREARKLQAQNDIAGALDLLDAAKTFSPATNLRLRTEQLRILCDAQENDAAVALANTLLTETEERALDNWDPDLALEVLLAARQALRLFDAQNSVALHNLQSRIARLKPAAILKDVLF